MIRFSEQAAHYAEGYDLPALVADQRTYDATLRNLELLGEAATHIPHSVRDHASNVPWRAIIAMRNRLIHGYLGVDDDTVWSVLATDLPALLVALHDLALAYPADPSQPI
jgi:uncharacterized protein with HEPN domain